MIAERLLSRLDGVRQIGKNTWIARCPAHDDKSPSLAMREVDDRLLLHCFAGCSVLEVVSAVGLSLSELYPEKISLKGNRPLRKPFPATDILFALRNEILLVVMCLTDFMRGEAISVEDITRLNTSYLRICAALEAGGLT